MRVLTKDVVNKAGKSVILKGWVDVRRDHGKLIFIDLRDRWGKVQVVFSPKNANLLKLADSLRPEWVVAIEGLVKERPKGMENPELPTGSVEIEAKGLEILSEAKTPPFEMGTDGYEIGEESRLKYRYLDLRRERLKKNMIMRDKVISFARSSLHERDFIEIETPILTKSTPEGARDYVVPSRIQPGKFYALPQSPQQYKQLLMVAGIERYFQVARAFRDEDTRGDRQPEFTQLDLEMSFASPEDVMGIIEDFFTKLVEKIFPDKKISKKPFPLISFKTANEIYGSDRPDLRQNKDDPNELAFAFVVDFPMFEKREDGGWGATHHPFTKIRRGDGEEKKVLSALKGPLDEIISEQYDIVLNGNEIGGGSIREHRPEILEAVFVALGHKKTEVREKFGHLLEAFEYGVPPHGGIAIGLERLIMILAGEPNIREVIAFPKTGDGRDLMMSAPSELSKKQLTELGLSLTKKK